MYVHETSAPIAAWKVKLSALLENYDRPSNQTNRPTDRRDAWTVKRARVAGRLADLSISSLTILRIHTSFSVLVHGFWVVFICLHISLGSKVASSYLLFSPYIHN